jgi:rSAM/selenodomain-associated transferase 1
VDPAEERRTISERGTEVTDTLYIAAKAPRVGLAKSRLGCSIGHESAVALYKAFLRDLAARFADAPFKCGWYVTPPDAWPEIAPLVAACGEARVLLQGEGDWTRRQRELFYGAAERGEERIILTASDSPHLTVEVVAHAFSELDRHDLVFGPTYDGGYYLVGMRGYHDVLHDVEMGTDTVMDEISARAERAELSVGSVEITFDVDEVEDLEYLRPVATRPDLAATRAVLEALDPRGGRAAVEPGGVVDRSATGGSTEP